MGFAAQDKPAPPSDAVPWAGWRMITRDYFKTIGVPLARWSRLHRRRTDRQSVARDHQQSRRRATLARRERSRAATSFSWKGQSENVAEVIGVAGDMRDWDLADDTDATRCTCRTRRRDAAAAHFVVHTTAAPSALIPTVRSILAEMRRASPLSNVRIARRARRPIGCGASIHDAAARVVGGGGVVARARGCVRRAVVQLSRGGARRSAMRMALGASRSSVLRLVLSQGMRPVVLGLWPACAARSALSRYMRVCSSA